MKNDPFELNKRIQKMLYQIQKQINILQPQIDQERIAWQSFNHIFDVIQKQQKLHKIANWGLEITESLQKWQDVINKFENLQYPLNPIPDVIYPKLEKLITTLANNRQEGYSQLLANIHVNRPKEQRKRNWNWLELANFLLSIFMAFQTFMDSTQSERHHTEVMEELEKHRLIQEKRLQIEKEMLEIEKAKLDALNSFLEFIEPYIPNDQKDNPESNSQKDNPENNSEDPKASD